MALREIQPTQRAVEKITLALDNFILESEICSICFYAIRYADIKELECKHIFHQTCLVDYSYDECPRCDEEIIFQNKIAFYFVNDRELKPIQIVAVELGQREPVLVHVFECKSYRKKYGFFEDGKKEDIENFLYDMHIPNIILNRIVLKGGTKNRLKIFKEYMMLYFGQGYTFISHDFSSTVKLRCYFHRYKDGIFLSINNVDHESKIKYTREMRKFYKSNTFGMFKINTKIVDYFKGLFELDSYFNVIP